MSSSTKPGPGALAEAFHLRVPVVVTRNASTIPQERYNADFVEELGLGLVVPSTHRMPRAAWRLVHERALRQDVVGALGRLPENRAVFDVLDLIESLAVATAERSGNQVEVTTPRSLVARAGGVAALP